jgi:hypothetical protein
MGGPFNEFFNTLQIINNGLCRPPGHCQKDFFAVVARPQGKLRPGGVDRETKA